MPLQVADDDRVLRLVQQRRLFLQPAARQLAFGDVLDGALDPVRPAVGIRDSLAHDPHPGDPAGTRHQRRLLVERPAGAGATRHHPADHLPAVGHVEAQGIVGGMDQPAGRAMQDGGLFRPGHHVRIEVGFPAADPRHPAGDPQQRLVAAQFLADRHRLGDVAEIERQAVRPREAADIVPAPGGRILRLEMPFGGTVNGGAEPFADFAAGHPRGDLRQGPPDQRVTAPMVRRGIGQGQVAPGSSVRIDQAERPVERQVAVGDALQDLRGAQQRLGTLPLGDKGLPVLRQGAEDQAEAQVGQAEHHKPGLHRFRIDLEDAAGIGRHDGEGQAQQHHMQQPSGACHPHQDVEGQQREEPDQVDEDVRRPVAAVEGDQDPGAEVEAEIEDGDDGDVVEQPGGEQEEAEDHRRREQRAGDHQPELEAGDQAHRIGDGQAEPGAGQGEPTGRHDRLACQAPRTAVHHFNLVQHQAPGPFSGRCRTPAAAPAVTATSPASNHSRTVTTLPDAASAKVGRDDAAAEAGSAGRKSRAPGRPPVTCGRRRDRTSLGTTTSRTGGSGDDRTERAGAQAEGAYRHP